MLSIIGIATGAALIMLVAVVAVSLDRGWYGSDEPTDP